MCVLTICHVANLSFQSILFSFFKKNAKPILKIDKTIAQLISAGTAICGGSAIAAVAPILKANSKETFDAMDMVSKINTKTYTPKNGAAYPKSELGQSLLQIAQLIRSDVGLEIGFAESNGWDTHFNQGTSNGVFMRNASDLGNSMAAFWQDMGEEWQERIVVMTMTEFGRTVRQNGTGGTDHGRASCYFLLGKNINGGKVHGKMETLSESSLEDGRDLAVTTDFRAVFSEVVQKQFSLSANNLIFPGWKGDSLGLMKG
jgi:uncharacterized protein (DUF1501 family)